MLNSIKPSFWSVHFLNSIFIWYYFIPKAAAAGADGGVRQRGGDEHEAGLFPEGLQTPVGEGQGAGRPGGGSQVRPAQDRELDQ